MVCRSIPLEDQGKLDVLNHDVNNQDVLNHAILDLQERVVEPSVCLQGPSHRNP